MSDLDTQTLKPGKGHWRRAQFPDRLPWGRAKQKPLDVRTLHYCAAVCRRQARDHAAKRARARLGETQDYHDSRTIAFNLMAERFLADAKRLAKAGGGRQPSESVVR